MIGQIYRFDTHHSTWLVLVNKVYKKDDEELVEFLDILYDNKFGTFFKNTSPLDSFKATFTEYHSKI